MELGAGPGQCGGVRLGGGVKAELQSGVELTAHPLQRIGAYALACLVGAGDPTRLTAEGFGAAVEEMRRHALAAAQVRDTKRPEGFWLKSSLSFFPNSPMNHPSNARKDDATVTAAVRRWRQAPDEQMWPGAACVLCGQAAVRFFGKLDVPLAESDSYRNTTPRGHAGMALCWPCVCSFHALPYGCRLTGGPAIAVHSWDEDFLRETVSYQVQRNRRLITVGGGSTRQPPGEVVALLALRRYANPVIAGVELLVFSNNNRGQTLRIEAMDQPLAEWLRRTARMPKLRRAFPALLRAHRTGEVAGQVGLARNAFRDPPRIVGACARYLADRVAVRGVIPPDTADLAELCNSFVIEVMQMNQQDLEEIKSTAARVAVLLSVQTSGGKLKDFYARIREPARLRQWLQRNGVDWVLTRPDGTDTPLVSMRGMDLLFGRSSDGTTAHHRQLLLTGVLEELCRTGWRPTDGPQVAEEMADDEGDELLEDDRRLIEGEEQS
jgi:hypothetical protein